MRQRRLGETGLGSRFEVCEPGQGADAAVIAWDTQLRRPVVLKRVTGAGAVSPRVNALLAAVPHPNLATVRHDFYDGDDRVLVMDHVPGERLSALLDASDSTPVDAERASRWMHEIAAAVAHLHALDPPVGHGAVDADHVVIEPTPDGERAVLVDPTSDAHPRRDSAALAGLARVVAKRASGSRDARRALVRATDRSVATPSATARLSAFAAVVLAVVSVSVSDGGTGAVAQAGSVQRGSDPPLMLERSAALSQPMPSGEIAPDSSLPAGLAAVASASTPAPLRATASTAPASRLAVYAAASNRFGQIEVFHLDQGPTPVLQLRTQGLVVAWSHIATLDDGWLFFYRAADGSMGSSPIERDGRLGYGDGWIAPQRGWTHVLGAGDEIVWFYRQDTGVARALRLVNGFHVSDLAHTAAVSAGFDQVTSLGDNRVLHYESASGRAALVTLNVDGTVARVKELALPSGWSATAATGSGHLVGVNATGRAHVVSFDEPEPVVANPVELGGAGWSGAVGFDRGVALRAASGAMLLTWFDSDGRLIDTTPWSVLPGTVVLTVT